MSQISLDEKQLAAKPKKVGTWKGEPVFGIRTKGGLNLVADNKGKILGSGPHRAIARKIAEKNAEGIKFNDLEKADWVDPAHYEWLLPKYIELTDHLRSMQDKE
jgi:hypothetical protein